MLSGCADRLPLRGKRPFPARNRKMRLPLCGRRSLARGAAGTRLQGQTLYLDAPLRNTPKVHRKNLLRRLPPGRFFCTQIGLGHMVTVKGARKERTSHSFPCGQTLKEACSCLSIPTKMTKQPQYLKLFSFSYFRQHALATFWQPARKERWRGGRGFFRCPARRCRRYVYRY